MNPLLYALNIGTLAAWLSVSGASTVACLVKISGRLPEETQVDPDVMTDGDVIDMDLFSAGSAPAAEVDTENNDELAPQQETAAEEEAVEAPETMEIPELPELAEESVLPEIPDLPAPKPRPAPRPAQKPSPSTANKGRENKPGTSGPAAKRTATGSGGGQGSGSSSGSGSGDVGAARFAGGRKPRPPYPAAARKQNIEGSVVVFITVDESGNVVNAAIRRASHPSLNDSSILNTLRRWKFKPGPRGSITQTIRFQLH